MNVWIYQKLSDFIGNAKFIRNSWHWASVSFTNNSHHFRFAFSWWVKAPSFFQAFHLSSVMKHWSRLLLLKVMWYSRFKLLISLSVSLSGSPMAICLSACLSLYPSIYLYVYREYIFHDLPFLLFQNSIWFVEASSYGDIIYTLTSSVLGVFCVLSESWLWYPVFLLESLQLSLFIQSCELPLVNSLCTWT